MQKTQAEKIVLETRKLRESISLIVRTGRTNGAVNASAIRNVEKKLFDFLAVEFNVNPITLRSAVEQSMAASADALTDGENIRHDVLDTLIVHETALAFGIEEKFIHMGRTAFLSIHPSF